MSAIVNATLKTPVAAAVDNFCGGQANRGKKQMLRALT